MSEKKILHNRAKCLECGEVVESTHRHDFRWCKCHKMAVDGGRDYIRRLAEDFSKVEELSEYEDEL
jgi:tRNA(Ile2) C34 agmatinyltransferase TiaS